MIPLNIDIATNIRTLTYYDRAAIRLTPDELKSVRLRVSVAQVVSPLNRSQNFKYPYPKEFYGYAQTFSRNLLMDDIPINYTSQYVWDYWNHHLTIAHQLTSVFQRLKEFALVQLDYTEFVLPPAGEGDQFGVQAARAKIQKLTEGLTLEEGGFPNDLLPNNDYVNSFNHPWDLIRFRFPVGTVFAVAIESWNAGNTDGGSSSGTPPTPPNYDPTNPSNNSPGRSDPDSDPGNPYGVNPPASSPLDPTLDPADFSNAPTPPPPDSGECLRVFGDVEIAGVDSAPRAVDFTFGAYPTGFTFGWELSGTSPSSGRSFYNLRIRGVDGSLIEEPITGDFLRSVVLQKVVCPPEQSG